MPPVHFDESLHQRNSYFSDGNGGQCFAMELIQFVSMCLHIVEHHSRKWTFFIENVRFSPAFWLFCCCAEHLSISDRRYFCQRVQICIKDLLGKGPSTGQMLVSNLLYPVMDDYRLFGAGEKNNSFEKCLHFTRIAKFSSNRPTSMTNGSYKIGRNATKFCKKKSFINLACANCNCFTKIKTFRSSPT